MAACHTDRARRTKRRGIVYVLALIFLSIFATLAISMGTAINTSVRTGSNQRMIMDAQMATESGMSFLCHHLRKTDISAATNSQSLLDAMATSLQATINTASMGATSITYDGVIITIPSITPAGAAGSFSATVAVYDASSVKLQVNGTSGRSTRKASIRFNLQQSQSSDIFDYGLATRGPIELSGNARIRGINNVDEAHVFTACSPASDGVALEGNSYIQGDLSLADANVQVSLAGNSKIAGYKSGQNLEDHIHRGVGSVTFPEIDTSEFEALATNLVTAGTSTSGNKTFTNIRIEANTNKTFNGNIKIYGVVFIEMPNQISFEGNLTITGVIVTQDAGDNNYNTNTISFSGNTTIKSPSLLPDEPQFEKLKELTGSFLLAPGFGTTFAGNFGTVSGCMAAETFTFSGNAGGTVKGTMISYSDQPTIMHGNANFYFDHSVATDTPAGFVTGTSSLTVDSATYEEQ